MATTGLVRPTAALRRTRPDEAISVDNRRAQQEEAAQVEQHGGQVPGARALLVEYAEVERRGHDEARERRREPSLKRK